MRKYAFVAFIMLITSVIAGCGGSSGASTTVIGTSNLAFVSATDISNKTVYILPAYPELTKNYQAYKFSDTTNGVTYDSALNLDPSPTLGSNGTWDIINGILTIKDNQGTIIYSFKRIQAEATYWLVYDTNNGNKISRIYIGGIVNGLTVTAQKAAADYLNSIYLSKLPAGSYLMGGSAQGNKLTFTGTADTIIVRTLAGSDKNTPAVFANTSSVGSERFNHPTGVTTDGNGNLYVADAANHMIRKVEIGTGKTTTVAGTGSADYSDNDNGTQAKFNSPQGITCDGTNLYVTDTGNALIRQISLTGTNKVTTLAGTVKTLGAVDSTTSGESAQFYSPLGITTDGTNLYITDASYHTIRKIKIATISTTDFHSQSVTTLAGSPGSAGSTDATATDARFNVPNRITTDGTNLYVTDFNNHTIRQIVIATGVTTTIAGAAGVGASSTNGSLTDARFYYPSGIITDGTNLFITEFNNTNSGSPNYNNLIRKIDLTNKEVSTIAGGSKADLSSVDTDIANGIAARFSKPIDLTSDGTNLFVSNYSNGYTDPVTKIVYPDFNNIRKVGP